MPETLRSFIALELEKEFKKPILEAQQKLKELNLDVKWVEENNLHLTLKFLGKTHASQIDVIKDILRRITADMTIIRTGFTTLGVFPHPKHPNIIWIGLNDERKEISTLEESLENALAPLGFKKENRPFHPHITLGRVKSLKNISLLINAMENYTINEPRSVSLKQITLLKSTLTPSGPCYETLLTIPFK